MMTFATVITDASFCHETKASAWAAWVRVRSVRYPIRASGNFKSVNCQSPFQAELFAAANGVALAIANGATTILVQTDCLEVVRVFNGKRSPLPKGVAQSFGKITKMIEQKEVRVTARHVKGHTRRDEPRFYVNRWCDKNAKKHMRTERLARQRAS